MDKEILFSTGQFSRLAQVTARSLRFYQEKGLLIPKKIGEKNGVRYYSAEQLSRVNLILGLKEAGLELSQIREFLLRRESGHENSLDTLRSLKRDLEREIKNKERRLGSLNVLIEAEETGDEKLVRILEAVRAVKRPPRSLISWSRACGNEEDIMDFFGQCREKIHQWQKGNPGVDLTPVAWSQSHQLDEAQDMEIGFFSSDLGPHLHTRVLPDGAKTSYLPGRLCARVSVSTGADFRFAYNSLAKWASGQSKSLGHPLMEEYTSLDWVVGQEGPLMIWAPLD